VPSSPIPITLMMKALSSSETSVVLILPKERPLIKYLYFVFLRSVRRLLVTANIVPSSLILVTLMMEALSSSESSVLTRATWRNVPEDGILRSHRSENLKSYIDH
jgi:hypothetical protein